MMNSFPSYLMIKSYYDKGYWDINQVGKAAELNRITTKQYETITGSSYPDTHLKTAVVVDPEDIPESMKSSSPVSDGIASDGTVPDSTTSTSVVADTDSAEKIK